MKKLIPLIFVFVLPLAAQVTITPNVPTYNLQALPGSTRQINVQITGGTLNTVNWSVLSTTGGASATFTNFNGSGSGTGTTASSFSGALPTIQVNIGSTAGNCSISGSLGSYTVSSTATVTVQAQSIDDTSKTATFLFNVCAKTTTVIVAPAYQQAYQGQKMTLQSWVSGDTDETGTWSIVSQPGGGNGSLADTGNRDTVFSATATGRYTIQYTSHSDPTKTATAIVYVSPNAMPSYAATPNGTQPHECWVDPALTGGDYEVGPGLAYTTIQSTPAAGSLAAGTIIRIHNTDLTGTNPTTYHEYYQFATSGTPTQPMIICGVPDSRGNLPIVDGANATGQSGVSIYAAAGWGIITTWAGGYGHGTPYGYWQSGSAGPSYISITGLHLRNAANTNTYTQPGGVSAPCPNGGSGVTCPWVDGASGANLRGGAFIDVSGNDLDSNNNGVFTAENANSGWVNITQAVTIMGNHIRGSGTAGEFGSHQIYFQSFYGLAQGNLLDNYLSTAQGSNVKWRGVEGIFRYNYLGNGPLRDFDLVENQDASSYVTFEGYLSSPAQTDCNTSFWCLGDRAGANIIEAYQESAQKDFVYGNLIFGASAVFQNHYAEDHDGGMADRDGTLYFFNNTLDQAQVVFDTGSGNGFIPYLPQRIDARNNIFWHSGSALGIVFNRVATQIQTSTTNLMYTGSFSITTPINGGSYSAGDANGWSSGCDYACPWPLTVPINPHLYGLTSANFLSTSTQPYDSTTMVASGAAIGAGTSLTGTLATMPLRWNYSVSTNSLTPRVFPLTVGAVDQAGSPTAATPTFSPVAGTYTGTQSVTISTATGGATLCYTTDGTTPTANGSGTCTHGTTYSTAVSVTSSLTLKAVASESGYVDSAVGSAAYVINSAPTSTSVGGGVTFSGNLTIH